MAERFEIMEKALLQMLESKKYATLRDMLITMNPSDVAGIFNDLEEKQGIGRRCSLVAVAR